MPQNPTRRALVRYAAAGIAAFHFPRPALPQTPEESFHKPETPDRALQMLLDGNARYVKEELLSFKENLAILRSGTEEKQEPFAAVLACADSRVPTELVFDQSIGHLFVVRIAGNVATSDAIASLEYGVHALGIKTILVLGHTNCGAVKAAVAGRNVTGQITTLFPYIYPALAGAGGDLLAATRANALLQASVLAGASPVLSAMVSEGKLQIRAALYDISSGHVSLL